MQIFDNANFMGRAEDTCRSEILMNYMQGQIQDLHVWGEGPQKIMSAYAHYESEILSVGFQGPLRTLEALCFFNALSYYLSLIFKHCDRKWDLQKTQFQLGGGPVVPPLDPIRH